MTERDLGPSFFDRDAQEVARDLLGKVLAHRVGGLWLRAAIVETEAYYLDEKGSHASLGYTEKRRALFMSAGTIYMYYARGGDSLNFSCRGAGNAVLIKGACPDPTGPEGEAMLAQMHRRNPLPSGRRRPDWRLCSGQTLLCRALGLRVPDWDAHQLNRSRLRLLDVGYRPGAIVCATRLGIPPHRDAHLPYRFIDLERVRSATHNPLRRREQEEMTCRILTDASPAAPRSLAESGPREPLPGPVRTTEALAAHLQSAGPGVTLQPSPSAGRIIPHDPTDD